MLLKHVGSGVIYIVTVINLWTMFKVTRLFIGNLPDKADINDLRRVFGCYGIVTRVLINGNFAFVHMLHPDMAQVAIDSLDEVMFGNEVINVELCEEGSTDSSDNSDL